MKKSYIVSIICFVLFLIILTFVILKPSLIIDEWAINNITLSSKNDIATFLFKTVSFIGSTTGVILITLLVYFFWRNKREGTNFVLLIFTGNLVSQAVKFIVRRSRPDISYHLVKQGGFSFVSGHTMMATLVYGYFIYLIYKYDLKHKNIYASLLGLFIISMGISRMYLGVHYLSDVLGGLFLGISYLIIFISIFTSKEKAK